MDDASSQRAGSRLENGFRAGMRLLWWEAAFAMVYETCVGPGVLSALAGEQGVALGLVAWLNALPFLGQVGQILGWRALRRSPSLKRHTLLAIGVARSLWFLPLFAGLGAVAAGHMFPNTAWFVFAAAVAAVATPLASSSAVAWLAWIRRLVPSHLHGRFLGIRLRFVTAATLLANALVFLVVGWQGVHGARLGFLVVLGAGVICGAMSTTLLSGVPLHRRKGAAGTGRPVAHVPLFEPLKDPRFRRVLAFGFFFYVCVHTCAPYFPYYFTHDLGFSTGTVAFWTAMANLGNVVFAGFWGRRTDRGGGAQGVLALCSVLIACSPLPYAIASREWVVGFAPFEYFVNGLAWAGFTVAYTSLLFKNVPEETGAAYFSIYSASVGVAGALGTGLGSLIHHWLQDFGGLRSLWWVGGILRLSAAGFGPLLFLRKPGPSVAPRVAVTS
jgi:hypothetical protein